MIDTLPIPSDVYDRHDYVDNEFGACLGCGNDLSFPAHYPPPAPPVPRQGDPPE